METAIVVALIGSGLGIVGVVVKELVADWLARRRASADGRKPSTWG